MNIALAFVILFGVFAVGGLEDLDQSVGSIKAGTPAAKVLQEGDRIVAVAGHRYSGFSVKERLEKFGKLVAAHECPGRQVEGCAAQTPVTLTVRRDGRLQTLSVRPRYDAEAERALIGFSYGGRFEPVGLGTAADHAVNAVWMVTSKTASVFGHIFESQQRKQISGIVGTSDVGHAAVEAGWRQALLLLALVSLSLGLINLLPILPLDGGHIFWAVMEKLRGRPISIRVVERATVIGVVLVVMLMFIGLSNDIGRLSGEGFNVR